MPRFAFICFRVTRRNATAPLTYRFHVRYSLEQASKQGCLTATDFCFDSRLKCSDVRNDRHRPAERNRASDERQSAQGSMREPRGGRVEYAGRDVCVFDNRWLRLFRTEIRECSRECGCGKSVCIGSQRRRAKGHHDMEAARTGSWRRVSFFSGMSALPREKSCVME